MCLEFKNMSCKPELLIYGWGFTNYLSLYFPTVPSRLRTPGVGLCVIWGWAAVSSSEVRWGGGSNPNSTGKTRGREGKPYPRQELGRSAAGCNSRASIVAWAAICKISKCNMCPSPFAWLGCAALTLLCHVGSWSPEVEHPEVQFISLLSSTLSLSPSLSKACVGTGGGKGWKRADLSALEMQNFLLSIKSGPEPFWWGMPSQTTCSVFLKGAAQDLRAGWNPPR